jgi:hypothetical protein
MTIPRPGRAWCAMAVAVGVATQVLLGRAVGVCVIAITVWVVTLAV